jgi:hypothetical protein
MASLIHFLPLDFPYVTGEILSIVLCCQESFLVEWEFERIVEV